MQKNNSSKNTKKPVPEQLYRIHMGIRYKKTKR